MPLATGGLRAEDCGLGNAVWGLAGGGWSWGLGAGAWKLGLGDKTWEKRAGRWAQRGEDRGLGIGKWAQGLGAIGSGVLRAGGWGLRAASMELETADRGPGGRGLGKRANKQTN